MEEDILLEIIDLKKYFPVFKKGMVRKTHIGDVKALAGVNIKVRRNEVLGIVGESGSGKTTLGRVALNLVTPSDGTVIIHTANFSGDKKTVEPVNIYNLVGQKENLWLRKTFQIVFQDPFGSLNPRMTVLDIISEALIIHYPKMSVQNREKRVLELLKQVGLEDYHASRYPHEFSGGQRQRIGIARALAVDPEIIILDEPVSALDVAVQAQILNLLIDLKNELHLTFLFIAHDLSVVRHISDRIVVMYLGKVMELAPSDEFFTHTAHPYTEALISAVPIPNPFLNRKRIILEGDPPNPINPPSGCVFRTRCRYADQLCAEEEPELREFRENHLIACHHPIKTNAKAILTDGDFSAPYESAPNSTSDSTFESDTKTCPFCGATVKSDDVLCNSCGKRL